MSRPPHPLLRPLWRQAGAPAAAMRALRASDRLLEGFDADRLDGLADDRALDPLLDPFSADDAVRRALDRLRASPPPAPEPDAARRAARAIPVAAMQDRGLLQRDDAEPARRLSLEPIGEPGRHRPPPAGATPQRSPAISIGRLDPMTRNAAQRAVDGAPLTAAARQAVAELLEGRSPPTRALLAAIEPATAVPSDAAAPPAAATAKRIAGLLARIEGARRPPRRLAAGSAMEPPSHELSAAPASGFRRLAARFARPAAEESREPVAPPAPAVAGAAPGSPASAADLRDLPPRLAAEAARPILGTVSATTHRPHGAAPDDAELAERLAQILRREARRQGIPDEGGVA